MSKNTAVFGIYQTRAQAEDAVNTFVQNRFRPEDISVLMADNVGTKDFAHEKHTKAPEAAATGAVVGGLAVGTLGLLAGLGTIVIPGVGILLAAGPIVSALAGIGAGGALGGIVAGLIGMGIPEYEAKRYGGMVRNGRILFSVHCDDSEWVERAMQLMKGTGAQDVSSAGESGADYAQSDKPRTRHGGGAA